jgi:DNA-binding transcriptional MerR regulator
MVKIGDFARMGRVSIKALRYYDTIGLLRPARVDTATGYRYYSAAQLPVLNRLLVYKNLGFSLDQTRALLDEKCAADRLRDLFRERQAELARRIELEKGQLAEVVHRIRQIEREESPAPYEVLVRDVEARHVVSVRQVLPDYAALDPLLRSLRRGIPKQEIEACGAIWHRCARSGQIDCEALIVLRNPSEASHRLEATRIASVVYESSDDDVFPQLYRAVLETIDHGHYEILWPMREIYHSDDLNITEVQFPIRRLGEQKHHAQ